MSTDLRPADASRDDGNACLPPEEFRVMSGDGAARVAIDSAAQQDWERMHIIAPTDIPSPRDGVSRRPRTFPTDTRLHRDG